MVQSTPCPQATSPSNNANQYQQYGLEPHSTKPHKLISTLSQASNTNTNVTNSNYTQYKLLIATNKLINEILTISKP